jgi:hypothetical protein
MKIKNIRQFRSLYKNELREIDSSNRNEHYVGVRTEINGKSQYGFFEIYHGDKEGFNESDGIRGFLEGFLDMAKDGQAVYEFMQNAVDAKSTNFCLFWGKDEVDGNTYLLVVNNGDMFNMDSIRSILNVGISTKTAGSYQIGKFGIGFKLAHRLVGKENGLDELIHDNYGPILFSWNNNEIAQLKKLIENPEVIPVNQNYEVYSENGKRKAIVKTNDPWLFKILVTNFPCQPENEIEPELIHDCQFKETNQAFSKNELTALGRWILKTSEYLNKDFEKGSLFFIRLGQGKQSHLEEENLEEGVKFSLAILNKIAKQSLNHDGLNTVNLQGKPLQPVPLKFEQFTISKNENNEEYRLLRFGKSENLTDVELSKEQVDKDIEILLGFTDYKQAKETFHNAPNFYLFFPLSEEKHKLRFILHSNAFYKSSSRTYLQRGSVGEEGINERLFKVFGEKLKERMLHWAASSNKADKSKFLELYANLLLSDASDNPERVWVNEPLWQPILKLLESNIPVKDISANSFTLVNDSKNVRIKDTSMPVDSENWLQGKIDWFKWDSDEIDLSSEAQRKLKMQRFNIVDLLQTKEIAGKINTWFEKTKHAQVSKVLEELNNVFTANIKPSDLFWDNLGKLKIWEFENEFLSLEEIGDEARSSSHLILFETLDLIKSQLVKGGWKLSKHSLAEYSNIFPSIQLRFQSIIKYIRNNDELIRVLNLKLPNADLTKEEKLTIIKTLAKKLSDDKEERISKLREIKLFRNTLGQVIPLKSLVKVTQIGWLAPFVIHSKDDDAVIDDYLISSPVDIYQNIIFEYWSEIINRLTSESSIHSLFDYAKGVYKQNSKLNILSEKEIIKIRNAFVNQTASFFYSISLSSFTESEYAFLESVLEKVNANPVPVYSLLKYYEEPPFKIGAKPFQFSVEQSFSVTIDEAKAFLKLCAKEDPEMFKKVSVYQNKNDEIQISPKLDNVHAVVSENPLVNNYITEYHQNLFVILPPSLKDFSTSITLQGAALIKRLTHDCDFTNEKQLSTLIEITLQSELDARINLADKIQSLHFELDKPLTEEFVSVKIVRLLQSLNDEDKAKENIKKKTRITFESQTIKLSDVQLFGNDEVIFEKGEKKYVLSLSLILINADAKATQVVGKLTEALSSLGVSEKSVLDKMFGLTGHVSKSFIAQQVKEKYSEQALENAHQLAFVMHYSSGKPKDFIAESFNIETVSSVCCLKEIILYTPENAGKFIPDEMVLNKRYKGIFNLLVQDSSIYKGTSSVMICNSPYFDNNKFHLPGIMRIETDLKRLLLLEFLFGKWRNEREHLENIYLQSDKKWNNIIGFEPFLSISGSDLFIESEKLPPLVQQWLDKSENEINSKEKYDFIRILGVSLSGADIVRIRKYLIGIESVEPDINYALPSVLIINTLILLSEQNIMLQIDSDRVKFIRGLYHRLSDDVDINKIPLPIFSPNSPNSIEFAIVESGLLIDSRVLEFLKSMGYNLQNLQSDASLPVVNSELLKNPQRLSESFSPANFTFTDLDFEKINANGKEWQRDFYFEWKGIFPSYQIKTYPGLMPRILKLDDKNIFDYEAGEIAGEGFKIIVNSERNEKSVINLIELHNLLPLDALNKLKELFLQYDESIQDFLNRVQANEKLREEWEKLKRREKEEQKKSQLSEEFGKSERYSMAWFMNLLELMVISGGGKDLANPEGDITFNKVSYNANDLRVISFGDPSKSISPSIELFTDFKATFTYLDKNEIRRTKEVLIKGITKKGHEVLAIPANPLELKSINLEGILYVELRFIRILDLINKLTRAFEQLQFEDSYNLKKELTGNIQFIFGPPGTGKTTHIANLIIEKIKSRTSKNVLVLTPTNKAADVLVKRILDQCDDKDYPDAWLVRYGASADIDLLDRQIVYDGNTLKFHLYSQIVMVTTIHRFPYERIITGENELGEIKTGLNEIAWDTIIFDEASMIMLPAIVYPLFKRKFKRYDEQELTQFIIGGDPLQIPPIFDLPDEELPKGQEDVKEENIYTMVGLKSFKREEQLKMERFGDKIENLTTQYRSIEVIGTLFSKFQYHNILKHGRIEGKGGTPNPRLLPNYFQKLGFRPITVIRYPVNKSDTIFDPQKLNSSPFQLYSSFLVNELVLKLRENATEKWDIGVIAPYRSQATLLNKLIENHKDKSNINVTIDTVHGFQGDQCDMVFAVFNPSSARCQFSYFLQKEFIINVAISRAKDYLFILLPDRNTEGIERLELIHEYYQGSLLRIIESLPKEMVAYLDAKDVETKIMGKADYFQKNSFTNVHQHVNIYSELLKDYIVRVSGNALDIHIKQQ